MPGLSGTTAVILGKLAQEPVAGLGGRGAMKIKLRPQGEHLLLSHQAGQDLFQPRVESLGTPGQVGLGDGQRGGRADGVFYESGVVADRRRLARPDLLRCRADCV